VKFPKWCNFFFNSRCGLSLRNKWCHYCTIKIM